jgi:hypothetical protein
MRFLLYAFAASSIANRQFLSGKGRTFMTALAAAESVQAAASCPGRRYCSNVDELAIDDAMKVHA